MNGARTRRSVFANLSYVRKHAQSTRGHRILLHAHSLYAKMRIACYDSTVHGCARQIPDPLPNCLRPPALNCQNAASARRGSSPRCHTPIDSATADSSSPCRSSPTQAVAPIGRYFRSQPHVRRNITTPANVMNVVTTKRCANNGPSRVEKCTLLQPLGQDITDRTNHRYKHCFHHPCCC